MILETDMEREAFHFICETADAEFSQRGCNDLFGRHKELFGELLVERFDTDMKAMEKVKYDFDVLFWLKSQVKK
jgi:hypothetical protein